MFAFNIHLLYNETEESGMENIEFRSERGYPIFLQEMWSRQGGIAGIVQYGDVAEWLKAAVSKTAIGETLSEVRILSSPQ